MAESTASIVATKVRPPSPPRTEVVRDRLRTRLATGFEADGSVGLICAPAGSGKSTLLTSFLADIDPAQVAWLSIDPYDNEPTRFWSHILAGLDGTGSIPLDLARAGDWARVVEEITATLDHEDRYWVVLDDYHEITTDVIHEHLDLLLRWLPPTARVVLVTRLDPPLPILPRLRLDGRLVEIRGDDLAFDIDEAADLLTAASNRMVDRETTSRLVKRTEGWAAGLHLAALSIRRTDDPAAVVDRFAGDDRLVTDYLRAEFLSELDEETRSFLLRTSVLDELSGELCDQVAETTGSAVRLRDLERSNMMLIPLDDRGRRFRNHHLIAHWLRAELALTEPDRFCELHARAARWYLDTDTAEPAYHHASASGDRDLLVEVAERFWHGLVDGGHLRTLRAWFDELGPAVETSASLSIGRAQLARNSGEPAEIAARLLQRAEQLVDSSDVRTVVLLNTNLVVHKRMIGDLGAAERHGRTALEAVSDPALVPEVRALLGATLAQLGYFDEAIDHLQGAIDTLKPESSRLTGLFARSHLVLPLYESGRRQQSLEAAITALEWADATDMQDSIMLSTPHTVLGLLALDGGDDIEAKEHLDRALEDSRRSKAATSRLHALLGLARHAAGDSHRLEAERRLDEARSVVAAMPDPGRLADLVEVTARQLLGVGATPTADGMLALVEDLTEREMAVLRLLPSELTLRDVGAELYVSHNTVKGHVKAIYRKLAVNSRDQAVARGRELGLL